MRLYVDTLQKANVSQAQMTFYMEAIANDATALIPMFQNGGKAISEMADMSEKLGLILDQKTIRAAQELETTGWLVNSLNAGAKNPDCCGINANDQRPNRRVHYVRCKRNRCYSRIPNIG
ncbi:Uncharacterised protein [Klebsiella pneumoniae]|nr:Uncharacterised protein [Klebsiella pneumoniae]